MTPDLPTRVREAFYATYNAALPDNTSPDDHDAATDTALAAVIAVVQEDRTREIVSWLGVNRSGAHGGGYTSADDVRRAIEREFGGNHPMTLNPCTGRNER